MGYRILTIAAGIKLGPSPHAFLLEAIARLPSHVVICGSRNSNDGQVELLLSGPWPDGPARRCTMLLRGTVDEGKTGQTAELVDDPEAGA